MAYTVLPNTATARSACECGLTVTFFEGLTSPVGTIVPDGRTRDGKAWRALPAPGHAWQCGACDRWQW